MTTTLVAARKNTSATARQNASANARKTAPQEHYDFFALTQTATAAPATAAPATERTTLIIEGMDKRVRRAVEKLLLLLPESNEPGEVWFTRWRRQANGSYSCRENLNAPRDALADFEAALQELAAEEGFMAQIERRAYAGAHV